MRRRAKKESERPYVFLYKIDFPDMEPEKIRLPRTFKKLLTMAEECLELVRPAKHVLDDLGNPYTDIKSIPPHADLYISCADAPVDEEDQPLYKSRLPRWYVPESARRLPPVKQPKPKPKPEDAAEHQAIALSPFTVRENVRNSLVALYSTLTRDQRESLPASDALQRLVTDFQQHTFEHQLLSQFIGPTSAIWQSEYGKTMKSYAIDKLKGLKPDDCRFVVVGPSRSGKSTILSAAATVFFQKLQISGDVSKYLMFPLNWQLYQLFFEDFAKLYKLYVTTIMASLKNARMDLMKVIDALQQWFLSIVNIQAMPLLPPVILHMPGFPKEVIISIGQKINRFWSSKRDFRGFVEATLRMPEEIARAFGFTNVVYVFDHLDVADVMLQPSAHFNKSNDLVSLPDLICERLACCPYFVAARDDALMFDMFSLTDFRQISTERMIQMEEQKAILVVEPPLVLNYEMCHGCPAYCATFDRVYDFIKRNEKIMKIQFTKLKSIVVASRKDHVRQELCRLCLLLSQADTDGFFTNEIMNGLQNAGEVEAHVR